MYVPEVQGFRYIVAARDDLMHISEGQALHKANSESLAKFFCEQIYCRYGMVGHVVTDNGSEVKGTLKSYWSIWVFPRHGSLPTTPKQTE